jgi:hypothetical protein
VPRADAIVSDSAGHDRDASAAGNAASNAGIEVADADTEPADGSAGPIDAAPAKHVRSCSIGGPRGDGPSIPIRLVSAAILAAVFVRRRAALRRAQRERTA